MRSETQIGSQSSRFASPTTPETHPHQRLAVTSVAVGTHPSRVCSIRKYIKTHGLVKGCGWQRSGLPVEIVGPPASGKTTIARAAAVRLRQDWGVRVASFSIDSPPAAAHIQQLAHSKPLGSACRRDLFFELQTKNDAAVRSKLSVADVLLLEHHVAFSQAFEQACREDQTAEFLWEDLQKPSLTIFLECDPATARERRPSGLAADPEFVWRMSRALERMALQNPTMWVRVLTVGRSPETVAQECAAIIAAYRERRAEELLCSLLK